MLTVEKIDVYVELRDGVKTWVIDEVLTYGDDLSEEVARQTLTHCFTNLPELLIKLFKYYSTEDLPINFHLSYAEFIEMSKKYNRYKKEITSWALKD